MPSSLVKPLGNQTMALTSAGSLGIPVANLPAPGGANNSGGVESGRTQSGIMLINANGAGGGTISLDFARFIFIAEMSEQLMPAHGYVPGGNRVGASRGEALSRILAEELFPEPAYLPQSTSVAPWVNGWLNSSPRLDYINQRGDTCQLPAGWGRALLPGKAAAISFEHQRSEAEEEVLKQISKALGADEESRSPTK
jgi:hypothetical protein